MDEILSDQEGSRGLIHVHIKLAGDAKSAARHVITIPQGGQPVPSVTPNLNSLYYIYFLTNM